MSYHLKLRLVKTVAVRLSLFIQIWNHGQQKRWKNVVTWSSHEALICIWSLYRYVPLVHKRALVTGFNQVNPSCEYHPVKSIAHCLPTWFMKRKNTSIFFPALVLGMLTIFMLLPTTWKRPHLFLDSFHPRTVHAVLQRLPVWKASWLCSDRVPFLRSVVFSTQLNAKHKENKLKTIRSKMILTVMQQFIISARGELVHLFSKDRNSQFHMIDLCWECARVWDLGIQSGASSQSHSMCFSQGTTCWREKGGGVKQGMDREKANGM